VILPSRRPGSHLYPLFPIRMSPLIGGGSGTPTHGYFRSDIRSTYALLSGRTHLPMEWPSFSPLIEAVTLKFPFITLSAPFAFGFWVPLLAHPGALLRVGPKFFTPPLFLRSLTNDLPGHQRLFPGAPSPLLPPSSHSFILENPPIRLPGRQF